MKALKNSTERSDAKRLEILKSAAAAFRHRGYYGASVDEIARALHMTKGNLYYYFKDKEEILFACHQYALDLLLKVLDRVKNRSYPPEEKLRRLIVAFVHTMIDELGGTSLTMDLQALGAPRLKAIIAKRDRFDQGIRQVISDGIQSRVFRQADPKLLTFAILGAINWIPYWFDPSGGATSVEIAEEYAEYLIAGLLNPERQRPVSAVR